MAGKADGQRQISVLHVVLSTETGGMENVIYNLATTHDPERLKLRVACLHAIGPLSTKLEARGIISELVPPMIPVISMIFPWSLIRFIKRTNCDIVHTHSGCWPKVAAASAWLMGVKLVYTEHGRTFPEEKIQIRADRLACRFTDRIVAVGEPLRDYLIKTVGLPAEKVVTIRNGIDTQRFAPRADRNNVRAELGYSPEHTVLVVVARLAPVKNHGFLIKTLHQLARTNPNLRLLIVGDGELRGALEQQVKELSLSGIVKFAGDRPDVERLLGAADIATLSSLSEGISLTILEAMATGLPVVATNVGGNQTIISEGINGYLVGHSIESYSTTLSRLIESRAMRETFGAKARQTVTNDWSLLRMAQQYQELYAELVA